MLSYRRESATRLWTHRSRLVVDYVIRGDEILSRTEVSRIGDFPIASRQVGFCDFMDAHLS